MGQLPANAIGIEVDIDPDGTDSPAHVGPADLEDPVATLRLAVAYLELVESIAADRDVDLELRGLEVLDKCTAVFARAVTPEVARQCAAEAALYLSAAKPPRGIKSKVEDVRYARSKLPPRYNAVAVVGGFRRPLERAIPGFDFAAARLFVRATPIRVGGKSPTATFESASEEKRFTIRLTRELAKRIAMHLYSEVDIEATVARAEDGLIEGGDLVDFFVVDSPPGDGAEGLRAWREFVQAGFGERR